MISKGKSRIILSRKFTTIGEFDPDPPLKNSEFNEKAKKISLKRVSPNINLKKILWKNEGGMKIKVNHNQGKSSKSKEKKFASLDYKITKMKSKLKKQPGEGSKKKISHSKSTKHSLFQGHGHTFSLNLLNPPILHTLKRDPDFTPLNQKIQFPHMPHSPVHIHKPPKKSKLSSKKNLKEDLLIPNSSRSRYIDDN